jgi:hypothetical protein
MSPPSRPHRALGAAAALVAGAAVAPAQAAVPADRAALQARVDAVRLALKEVAADDGAPASWTVAQATNWTNWPKWSKWSNWANK